MGLHKAEEIEEFGKNDLKVLSEILADKPFFFGDEPTTVNIKLNFTFICILIIDFFFMFSWIALLSQYYLKFITSLMKSSTV